MIAIKTVNVRRYLEIGTEAQEDCRAVADALRDPGCLFVRDDRLPNGLNDAFQALMLGYFRKPPEVKGQDEVPNHQVGWTPAYTEGARRRDELIARMEIAHRPHPVTGKDPKERFFAPLGDPPTSTAFPTLNPAPIIPKGIDQHAWETIALAWGRAMLATTETTAEMAAVGFGLSHHAFTRLMQHAPHLLAPTGTDLTKYGKPGTVWAAFHNDLNLLSAQGPANLPGLFGWTRRLCRFPVRVPRGHLFIQAGQELEHLTGGEVLAGFHEVVATEEAQPMIQAMRDAGRDPWRVTSTCFAHLDTDATEAVLAPFRNPARLARYPTRLVGEHVQSEIDAIGLTRYETSAQR